MNYTKEDAIRIVTQSAKAYKNELQDKTLLFICMDKHKHLTYVEFSFKQNNFMHLTGLRLNKAYDNQLSASHFFEKCINHKLSPNDFEFSQDGTTQLKLSILPFVINKNLSANMIGDFHCSHPKLYTEKLAGGTKACIGFVKDTPSSLYYPNTILKEDLRNHVSGYSRIIITYRKSIHEQNYSEIVYSAKNIDWSKIHFSQEYSYLPKPI